MGHVDNIRALRARGWVFWEARLLSGWVDRNRNWASCDREEDELIDHSRRECAEERLIGVVLPSTDRDRIRADYMSTFHERKLRSLEPCGAPTTQ